MSLVSTYKKEILIAPSMCDYSGKLSAADTLAVFMDIATEHADMLNIGIKELSKQDLFWLTVKTKVHFESRPAMGDLLTLETWPEKPRGLRCVRDYTLSKNGEPVVTAKTEWAVMNMKTGQLQKGDNIYPSELEINEAKALPEAFERFYNEAFDDVVGEYVVRSVDIDIGRHMNNIAYLRAFLACSVLSSANEAAYQISKSVTEPSALRATDLFSRRKSKMIRRLYKPSCLTAEQRYKSCCHDVL